MVGSHPIKAYRIQRGITQKALGAELGVTDVTIWRWENGDRQVGRDILPDVAAKTGIPAKVLRPDLAELMNEVATEGAS